MKLRAIRQGGEWRETTPLAWKDMRKAAWNLKGTRDATERIETARTAELLTSRLRLIHQWHQGMVSPRTGMLEYLYMPETDTFVRENCPIRDIAPFGILKSWSAF